MARRPTHNDYFQLAVNDGNLAYVKAMVESGNIRELTIRLFHESLVRYLRGNKETAPEELILKYRRIRQYLGGVVESMGKGAVKW